ncbi:MAG: hypothetical protein AAB448_04075, partial [Patescibacteria group bacterium]
SLYQEDPKDSKKPHYTQWGLKSPEEITLILLSVKDLRLPSSATLSQIYEQAEELGLELCPPGVGPRFRLQYVNQPMYECVYVGMEPIADSNGDLNLFYMVRNSDGSWLSSRLSWRTWSVNDQFVFRLRKKPLKS